MEKNFYEYRPICNKIKLLEETTERVGKNTFARNLGDLTVTFQCKETIVAPVSDDQCYSMLKVQDLNGKTWHLDSDIRILSKTALHIPCTAPFIPIYKTVKGDYVTFVQAERTLMKSTIPLLQTELTQILPMGCTRTL